MNWEECILEQAFPGKLTTMVVDQADTEEAVAEAIEKEAKARAVPLFLLLLPGC